MPFQGLIEGTLGYELRKEFLGNSLFFRELEIFNYEIYAADFESFDPSYIQQQIAQNLQILTLLEFFLIRMMASRLWKDEVLKKVF